MGFRACTMLWTMALCATVVMTATQGCIYDPDGACGPNQVKGYLGYCECDTGYEQVNLPGGVNFECRNLPEATDGGMVGDASVDAGMPSDISDIQGCSAS